MESVKYQKYYSRLYYEDNNNVDNLALRIKFKEDTGKLLILDN